jgi:hypothetical protein
LDRDRLRVGDAAAALVRATAIASTTGVGVA